MIDANDRKMRRPRKATLKQVAELANVSSSTASMILNSKSGFSFSKDTVERVWNAAERLGFLQPAQQTPAKSVFQRKVVAIFSSTVTGYYYTALVQAIEQAAQQAQYETVCFQTYHTPTRELSGLSMFSSSDIAGIIFTYTPVNYDMLDTLPDSIPVVVIGESNPYIRKDMVELNNFAVGQTMARHMLSLGHRKVAFLNDRFEWDGYPSTRRLKGAKDVFDGRPDAELIVLEQQAAGELSFGSYMTRRRAGYEMMRDCLRDHTDVTAVMAITDVMAYGVLEAMRELGLRAPEDYSVSGFDNNLTSDLLELTTIEHHVFDIGVQAFHMLHTRIQNADKDLPGIVNRSELLCNLIHRRSTAPPRA
ncbi:LacI family transcriptional regulator [Eubacteriales bacterium OttesenSCG-928-A19]|nr:LacI family transcriptional regulator [Eubacteriales bacterium OttesenSCG-928-A19]